MNAVINESNYRSVPSKTYIMSTFSGFSDEDLERMQSSDRGTQNEFESLSLPANTNIKRIVKIGSKAKKPPYKSPISDTSLDDEAISFDKCRLTLKQTPKDALNNNSIDNVDSNGYEEPTPDTVQGSEEIDEPLDSKSLEDETEPRSSVDSTPEAVRAVAGYTEDGVTAHQVKLEELQLRQKLMEEQNKMRKEMLSKALADRTRQTAAEAARLARLRAALAAVDGRLARDVAALRGRIDAACLVYADAEKHYLKVEKEFLQAKINLQKAKEKKELLTEHLCALITHNEARKAQRLETLMAELDRDVTSDVTRDVTGDVTHGVTDDATDEDAAVVVDGVDERTGKMVELVS